MCCELPKLEAGILDNNEFIAANTISSPPIRNGPYKHQMKIINASTFATSLFVSSSRLHQDRRDTECNRIQITIRSNIYWPVINARVCFNCEWCLVASPLSELWHYGRGRRVQFYYFQNHSNHYIDIVKLGPLKHC